MPPLSFSSSEPKRRQGAALQSPHPCYDFRIANTSSPRSATARPYNLSNEAVERALLTGEYADLLRDYFADENYDELQQLARQAANRGTTRGGPRTLILPGILGSTIGRKRPGPFDDVLWFDPIDIFNGRLSALALNGGPSNLQPLGAVEFTYLRMKLSLVRDGYDAHYHPYDWRLSLETAARGLLERISKEGASQINLVAHSMGGLVARAALGIGQREGHPAAKKIRRVVMLGTPNFGSFAPVQVLRATYGTVRKVAALDRKHDAPWLAKHVLSTFPSLCETMPDPEKFNAVDLYRVSTWPADGLSPRQALLDLAPAIRRLYAPGSNKLFLVVGVNMNTTVGMRVGQKEFLYEISKDGDGTVPRNLALLPDARTYYIPETHGSLPNNPLVARAVAEILDRGETRALPDHWSPPRSAPIIVPESELRVSPFDEAHPMNERAIRHSFDEFASPDYGRQAASGRRPVASGEKRRRLEVTLALGSITEVDARAYVLGLFRDVTPGGAARDLDERLGGAITDLTLRRMFSAGVGEIFMLPAARSGLRTEVIVFAGLGWFDRFSEEVQEIAAENVIRTLLHASVEELATVLIGSGSGSSVTRSLRTLMNGFARALDDADSDQRFRRVILCEKNLEKYREIRAELSRLAPPTLELSINEVTLASPEAIKRSAETLVTGGEQPVYLIVRVERQSEKTQVLRSSVLTAGPKAAVVTGSMPFSPTRIARILAPISNQTFHRDSLAAIGNQLAAELFDQSVRTVLPAMRKRHLIVVHDAESSRVPWEVLSFGEWFPAAEAGLSHRYAAENLSVAKWLEERREDGIFSILLVVNPTEDLAGAEAEGTRLKRLFGGEANVRIDEYRGGNATKPALLHAFRSGAYDVVHYAGHAFFDAGNPAQSGILCHGGTILSGADLAGLVSLPTLVFFNACESARVRRATRPRIRLVEKVTESAGLAEAFLRGGVANFLGTYWPVSDSAADTFASIFYERLLAGRPIGEAIQQGRRRVMGLGRNDGRDWADYLHYGDPLFVLKKT